MGILDVPALSRAAADARYAPLTVSRSRANAMAWLGDSRVDMMSDNFIASAPTITAFAANGIATWVNFLTYQCLDFDDSLNFGKSGDKIADAAARVPNVIASGAPFCTIVLSTNDLAVTPIATILDQYLNLIILPLQRGGVQPWIYLEYPRIGLSALALGVKNQINYFLRRLGNSQGSVPQAVRAVIIDANGYMENFA
ncbi:hypothetical protein, partial [Paraburkholderia phenoliruptrix]|uniref:hypothetical protein n=1 Tax=Paraburkholderia phenoliruptrix TaxID=252970 RepID=UPI0034CD4457